VTIVWFRLIYQVKITETSEYVNIAAGIDTDIAEPGDIRICTLCTAKV